MCTPPRLAAVAISHTVNTLLGVRDLLCFFGCRDGCGDLGASTICSTIRSGRPLPHSAPERLVCCCTRCCSALSCFSRLGTLSSKLQKKTHPKTLSSKNTFIQKHFHPKTLSSKTISSKTEDNFIHDTFIQKRVHPMTLSSKNGFIQ